MRVENREPWPPVEGVANRFCLMMFVRVSGFMWLGSSLCSVTGL
jgi:hypothetical protein